MKEDYKLFLFIILFLLSIFAFIDSPIIVEDQTTDSTSLTLGKNVKLQQYTNPDYLGPVYTIKFNSNQFTFNPLAISPDGRILAYSDIIINDGSNSQVVYIWDITKAQLYKKITDIAGPVQDLTFSPSGSPLSTNLIPNLLPISAGILFDSLINSTSS